MNLYDKDYCNLYSGDEVLYDGKKYTITILDGGYNLSNSYEELYFDTEHNDVLELEVSVDYERENDLGLFGL